MKNIIILSAVIVGMITSIACKQTEKKTFTETKTSTRMKTLYDFHANSLNGRPFDFLSLKGKKVLIVNTASQCGYTNQYEGLEELYKKYGSDKFVIIGFPSNDFGAQEPGSNEEI